MSDITHIGPGERRTIDLQAELDEVDHRHVMRYQKAINLALDAKDFLSRPYNLGVCWDVACGTGYGTELLARQATFVYGFDRSAEAIEYARAHHGVLYTDFHQVDIASPGWADAFLLAWEDRDGPRDAEPDTIICIETLEHLTQPAQMELWDTFQHVLPEDGVLVVMCPVREWNDDPNPHHLYVPSAVQLASDAAMRFQSVSIRTDEYESTSGPATQATVVCSRPHEYDAA